MVTPVWPSQVPYENVADSASAGSPWNAPIVSETEGGPPIMRPRPGPRATEITWHSQPLEPEEWEALELFLRVALYQGTRVFDMPVYRPGSGYVSRKCKIKNAAVTTDFSAVPWTYVAFTLIVFNW